MNFREIDAGSDVNERDRLFQISGNKILPQIFVDGKYIGGYDKLEELEEEDALDEVLGIQN